MKAQRHDFEDIDQCCRQLAARLVATARECVAARGRFTLALAGGSTPKGLYQLLAQPPFAREMPWQRTHFFWGDERCVPADHPDSNFGMARDAMLAMVPASLCHVHRMDGDLDPATAAGAYEGVLRSFFKLKKDQESTPRFPSFDTILLGMGVDGHTASIFPNSTALIEKKRWVVASSPSHITPLVTRLTLTLPVLNSASSVIFLVAGPEKRGIVDTIFNDPQAADHYPAGRINPMGELHWYVAAS